MGGLSNALYKFPKAFKTLLLDDPFSIKAISS